MQEQIGSNCYFSDFCCWSYSAQEIVIRNPTQELINLGNSSFIVVHLNIRCPDYEDRPIPVIREICKFLQINNYLGYNIIYNSLQEIDDDQLNWDFELGRQPGGHPIFDNDNWNPLYEWHTIQYKGYLYIIKGQFGGKYFRIKIEGER